MGSLKSNSNGKLFSFSWGQAIIFILVAMGIYFLIPKIVGFKEGVKILNKTNPYFLVLAVAAEFLSYLGLAWLFKKILQKLKYYLNFSLLLRISSIGVFAIHFLPLGGAGEAAVNYYLLRNEKVSSGDALFLYIAKVILIYVTFLGIFLIGLVLTPTHPNLTLAQKIFPLTLFVIVIAAIWWARYLYKRKRKFFRTGNKFLNFINFISQKLFNRVFVSEAKKEVIVNDVFEGFRSFAHEKSQWPGLVSASALYWLGDMLCLFFSLLCFGYFLHPGVLIFIYSIAIILGFFSFIPGGLGVIEGSLALLLVNFGVPTGAALFSVLLYRLLSFWLIFPVGAIAFITLRRRINYQKSLKAQNQPKQV